VLLRRGRKRNAAGLANQAFAGVVLAVAATEHGWPLDERHSGLEAVPEDNPFQQEIIAAHAFVDAAYGPALWPNGQLAPEPDPGIIVRSLDRIAVLIEAVGNAFGVDLKGSGPAKSVVPIRVEAKPVAPPSPARAAAAGQEGPRRAPDWMPGSRPAAEVVSLPKRPRLKRGRLGMTPQVVAAAPGAGRAGDASPSRARRGAPDVTSTLFWSLMERWKIGDLEALRLIGHPGGLTKKGIRPRFRVKGQEAELFSHLREIEAALVPLAQDPGAWLRRPIKDAPYRGVSPLRHICQHGIEGARDVAHTLFLVGLQRSI
jgi:hypothetical protein